MCEKQTHFSNKKLVMYKMKVCSIARKLQFYKMFNRAISFLLLFIGLAISAQAQNYVRFSKSVDSVYESSPYGYIYVECNNTTADTFNAFVVLNQSQTNVVAFEDFFFSNKPIVVPPGFQRDTFKFDIYDNEDYDPGKKAVFTIINIEDTSFITADTTMVLEILNDDSFKISFVGAGRTVVENDTTIFIRVATNGISDSVTTAKVKLDMGNAVKGKHFLFNDTTISIAALARDTALIPVVILNDTVVEAMREANFTLYDATNNAILNVRGFTLTIRDDDLQPSGITENYFSMIKVFPNPAVDFIQIENMPEQATIQVFDLSGSLLKEVAALSVSEKLPVQELADGVYLLKISSGSQSKIVRVAIAR